jgi:hypothetical protein
VGPRNRKLPIGRFGSCRPGARPAHGLGDRHDRLVLADHASVEVVLHLEQLLLLGLT